MNQTKKLDLSIWFYRLLLRVEQKYSGHHTTLHSMQHNLLHLLPVEQKLPAVTNSYSLTLCIAHNNPCKSMLILADYIHVILINLTADLSNRNYKSEQVQESRIKLTPCGLYPSFSSI